MRIMFVNNLGGGFAQHIDVAPGTTVAQLFEQKMPGKDAGDYLIRVNRQHVPGEQVLVEGDRLSITPTKLEGARA